MKIVSLFFLFVTTVVNASTSDVSQLIRLDVEKYTLENGLTVLLYEDHTAPIVSYNTWFRVGSKDETPGLTGMAHLFEHMMFKGAKRYTGEQFDKILQANGAVNNAFTTQDYTGYYIDGPSNKLELIMDIESDRMVNLQVTEENLKAEREVVKEERRLRTENSVVGTIYENMFSTVYKVHPYRWPVVGWMQDLNRMTVVDCQAFYKNFYAPNNAVIVVAGDIDKARVKGLIKKYYGSLEASKTLKKSVLPAEPAQRGERFQQVNKKVETPTLAVAFRSSKAGDDETFALDLLASILGSGESSRLHRRLVYSEQKALSAKAFNLTPQEPGIFEIMVSLRSGATDDDVLKAIYGEIWKVRKVPVSEQELSKVKNQVMMEYVSSMKTIRGKANVLALNEIMFGNYQVVFDDLIKYNNVTREQILQVADKYLRPEQRSVVKVVSP